MRTPRLAAATLLSLILALPVLGASHEPPSVGAFAEVSAAGASVDDVDPRRAVPMVRDVPSDAPRMGADRPRPVRPAVVVPPPHLIVVNVGASASPYVGQGHRASGTASWYCGHGSSCTRGYPSGLYAAAGPALRVGQWRGRRVHVEYAGRSIVVVLIDWCACPGGRVLDLYRDAFSRLADPSRGVVTVSVSW